MLWTSPLVWVWELHKQGLTDDHRRRRLQLAPLAAAGGAEAAADNAVGPPNLLWRVAAAMMYLIPWIDTIHIGREIYHRFPITVIVDRLPGAQPGPRRPFDMGPRGVVMFDRNCHF